MTIFNDMLVVSGDRENPARPEKVRYYEVGINFGRFRSEVFLPIRVNPDCVEAELENGMLSIQPPQDLPVAVAPVPATPLGG